MTSADRSGPLVGVESTRPVPVPGTVGADIVELATARERTELALVDIIRGFDTNQLYADDGYRSLYSWMRDHTDLSRGDAGRIIDTARFLDRHDLAAEAVASGTLALAKASAMARVDTPARHEVMARDLPALISATHPLDVDAAARVIAHWARLADDEVGAEPDDAKSRQHLHASRTLAGMVRLDGLLDAETGSLVLAALEALDHPDTLEDGLPLRSRSQRNAENLAEMARRSLASDGHLDPDRTVNVIVDSDLIPEATDPCDDCDAEPDLFGERTCAHDGPGSQDDSSAGAGSSSDDEPSDLIRTLNGRSEIVGHGPVHPKTVARMMCSNWISRAVLGPDGALIDLGRRARLFSPAQRRAIIVRDGHCVFPGCDAPPERCDVHHLHPWEHGGATDLHNGCLLCRYHHHCVHEGGWTLRRGPGGVWVATRPEAPRPARC